MSVHRPPNWHLFFLKLTSDGSINCQSKRYFVKIAFVLSHSLLNFCWDAELSWPSAKIKNKRINVLLLLPPVLAFQNLACDMMYLKERGGRRTIKKICNSTCATHQGTAKTLHAMQKHFTQHNIGQTYGIKNVNPPSSNKDHTSTVPDSSGSSHRTLFKLRQTMQPNLILKATCNVWT